MGTVTIQSYTYLKPITMIGAESGVCCGADVTDPEKNYRRGIDCLESEHGRTMEFPDVYMILKGYSARVIREWYTHIGGSPTRLQASTRYIDYEHGFDYYIPESIRDHEKARPVYEHILSIHDVLQMPTRATSGSAGYDFKSPVSFTLPPHKSVKIPTGIRVKIEDGWWLACLPRSSLGFKYQAMLANTVGVIDADYYHSDNEGHIFIKLVNRGDQDLSVDIGESFVQAIFLPYGITYSDNASAVRNGGMGSTGK